MYTCVISLLVLTTVHCTTNAATRLIYFSSSSSQLLTLGPTPVRLFIEPLDARKLKKLIYYFVNKLDLMVNLIHDKSRV